MISLIPSANCPLTPCTTMHLTMHLGGDCPLLLAVIGLNERAKRSQAFISTFSEMVSLTDKALVEFSEIDEKYLRGEETKESYEEAWYDLNFKLEQIKEKDDRLQNPPKELTELVNTYRAGFYRVFSITNDVVDYLRVEKLKTR
jgi:hypothetical protein